MSNGEKMKDTGEFFDRRRPYEPTSGFVGRHNEIEELSRLFITTIQEFKKRNRLGKRVLLFGPAGIGKTELSRKLIQELGGYFPGGYWELLPGDLEHSQTQTQVRMWLAGQREVVGTPFLLIDDYDGRTLEEIAILNGILSSSRWLPVLQIARRSDVFVSPNTNKYKLEQLNLEDSLKLLKSTLSNQGIMPTTEDLGLLAEALRGHPLAIGMASAAIAQGMQPSMLLSRLGDYQTSGIILRPNRVLLPNEAVPHNVSSDIVIAGEELLDRIGKSPEKIYDLSPRKFEEVVAEILQRLGYSVRVTPATRDGGKDIYVATRKDLGSFLYLVECKHFRPDRPVGVGIVREMYGVLAAERATAGILVTTSYFTKEAMEFTETVKYQVSLRDYIGLQEWIDLALGKKKHHR
jgi:restriction system protein